MNKQQYSLITKKYAKNIWRKYIKTIEEYGLICDGDRIYVPEDGTAAGRLTSMLLNMTAEFKMYNIEIIEEADGEEAQTAEEAVLKAKRCGCNKIAFFGYFQEIMNNTLWEMLYNGRIYSMLPKEKLENVTVIRPLYMIRKENIEEWAKEAGIKSYKCEVNDDKSGQLEYISQLIERLSENNEAVENNVFGSVTNVDADMLIGYNLKDEHHEFLEWYQNI